MVIAVALFFCQKEFLHSKFANRRYNYQIVSFKLIKLIILLKISLNSQPLVPSFFINATNAGDDGILCAPTRPKAHPQAILTAGLPPSTVLS